MNENFLMDILLSWYDGGEIDHVEMVDQDGNKFVIEARENEFVIHRSISNKISIDLEAKPE